jgi:hypothetical protein
LKSKKIELLENAKNKNKNMGSGLKDQISHCQKTSSKVFGSHHQNKKNVIRFVCTVKLGYNKLHGPSQFCS